MKKATVNLKISDGTLVNLWWRSYEKDSGGEKLINKKWG